MYEISETPQVEDTSLIENEALKLQPQKEIKGATPILKIQIDGEPFYHFSLGEFDNELATRSSFVRVGSKVFYKGIQNKRLKTRLNLKSL